MESPRQQGRRIKPIIRCSTNEQSERSPDDQLAIIRSWAESRGDIVLDAVRMEGRSGSLRSNMDWAVDQVIAADRAGERVDAAVVYDQSRMGRIGGFAFGAHKQRLEDAGIGYIAIDCPIEGPHADFIQFANAEAARAHAISIAASSARSSQISLERGLRGHSTQAPYGLDRLYLNAKGEELFAIRKLADGTSLRLDPRTGAELERYPKGVRPYRKGGLETATLCPGADELREVVIAIYRMRHEQDWRGARIARELNDWGIPSPRGRHWMQDVVNSILVNEVYTGFAYAHRYTDGIYFRHKEKAPERVSGPGGRKVRGLRPRDEWFRVDYPRLAEYLPPDLREAAMEWQEAYWERYKDGHIKSPERGQRPQHPLSGIMVESTTGAPMSCTRSGRHARLYYFLNGRHRHSSEKTVLRRRLPSAPIHRAIAEQIEMLICDDGSLRDMLRAEIRRQEQERRAADGEAESLRARYEKLGRKLASQIDLLGEDDDTLMRDKIEQTKAQRRAVQERLAEIDEGPRLTAAETDKLVEGLVADLQDELAAFAEAGDPAFRRLTETLISSAMADLEKGEVAIEFAVPASMIERRVMGMGRPCGPKALTHTHKWRPLVAGRLTVFLPKRCGKGCWKPFVPQGCDECRRQRRAA
ncbi:MAG: recombinase family protein [Phycisphaerales bacterium]|nr:recombinase family protein [Planctomycetota bacterium]MCH8507145.1 recombinase family protein [Phycisphaerales bacterium]